jgi:hypothetical protein
MTAADHFLGDGSKYEQTSDENGLFSISGIHGMGLVVTVTKKGYYFLPQSNASFGYAHGAGELPPHTDPNDPAVFILRKMGETESLIMINKDIEISRTGTPVFMDLHTGRTYGLTNGDVQVQSWTHDKEVPPNQKYDWRCQITVPGGGLQPRTGDFDFTAPEDGYQPSDEIDMSASDPKWKSSESREYFLKLPNGEFARISFTMGAGGYNTFDIISYLNPQPEHRNLEYDPNQQTDK